jgi:hypothetical protein
MNVPKKNNWGKWLIFSIGLLFTVYSIFIGSLALFGTETNAKLTSYRQQLGERDETIRNQYTYVFSYEFEYQGKTYSGTRQKIGNSVYLKNKGNNYINIKFLPAIPQLSAAYEEKTTLINMLISLVIGLGLMYVTTKME